MSRSLITCPFCKRDFPEDPQYAPNDWNSHRCVGMKRIKKRRYDALIDLELMTLLVGMSLPHLKREARKGCFDYETFARLNGFYYEVCQRHQFKPSNPEKVQYGLDL